MSDAVTVPRGAVSQIKARLMSYLFGACQPDHGSVFGWFDDHADEALEFALRDALAASTPVGAGECLPPISLDGPHKPGDQRQWLARQLLDSRLTDAEAYSTVTWHPAITDLWRDTPPPPSVSIDNGSRPQEAVPGEGHSAAVVATLITLMDNLVIAQSLSREYRQHATDEARSYLYDLRHQPADGCSSNEGADGWIEHDGGPNPVPGQRVDVRWRDGEVSTDEPSRDWCWKPTDGDDTIIAYRIAGSAHD